MFQDQTYILADAENFNSNIVGTNSGAGGLNEDSVNLALDFASTFNDVIISDIGPTGGILELAVNISTAFTSATDNATNEWRLISLPIALSLLDNGAGTATGAAADDGKVLSIASVALTDATDDATITGHGLALGTPFYITALATTTGVSDNTIYYAVPTAANTLKFATSFANAVAGTTVTLGTGDGTATFNFIPWVHATTGPIQRVFCGAGARFVAHISPFSDGPFAKRSIPTGQTVLQPQGCAYAPTTALGGGGNTTIVPQPGRYMALQHVPSATMTDGIATVDLSLNTQTGKRHYPTAQVSL